MIDNEIATLVHEWRTRARIEENSKCSGAGVCLSCVANGYVVDYEITYQVEGSASSDTEGARDASSHSDGIHYTNIWALRDEPELCHEELKDIHCDQTHEASNPLNIKLKIQKHKPQLRSIISGKHFPLEDEKCNITQFDLNRFVVGPLRFAFPLWSLVLPNSSSPFARFVTEHAFEVLEDSFGVRQLHGDGCSDGVVASELTPDGRMDGRVS
ncbi:uncharacterized protein HKW66_Vig0077210 [Vigna angularis]|uniref:Uncharacterized protein n=1 Tax=Phaseolus angularis TaxID=3914 RepID=A0A8T0K5G1_PHAAN|nr:uncharacterized protein HKW66_Vig0077210 [Vigna angularis]